MLVISIDTAGIADERPTGHVSRSKDSPIVGADGSRWGFHPMLLLKAPLVDDTMQLSESQRIRLNAIVDDFLVHLRDALERSEPKRPEQSGEAQRDTKLIARQMKLLKRAADQVLELLTETQRKRLDQIAFQLRGADALYREDVGEDLGLDEVQRMRVLEIRAGVVRAAKKLAAEKEAQRLDAEEFSTAINKLNAQALDNVLALLNEEQRERLSELQGPPIGFSRARLRLSVRSSREAVEK